MTMLFSIATPQLIVMTADAAVLNEFVDRREYGSAKKYCCYEGVGCVTTWGARVGNRIEEYLGRQGISSDVRSVVELADLVMTFLVREYRAHDPVSDDIGYHVAGFDHEQRPRLYHILWGVPRPNPDHEPADYRLYDHSPTSERPIQLLYNGRNDIADKLVGILIGEIQAGRDVGFDIGTLVGLVRFGDFVARCAAELTPMVSPPFTTVILSSRNRIEALINDSYCPLSEQAVRLAVGRLEVPETLLTNENRQRVETHPHIVLGPAEYTGGTITALPGSSNQATDTAPGPD